MKEISEWITALSTLALAVITGILALYTYRLWRSGKDSSERQLRAYLGIADKTGIIYNSADCSLSAYICFKNCGQTPAYKFKSWISLYVLSLDEDPWNKVGSYINGSILGPGDLVGNTCSLKMNPQIYECIILKKMGIFFWGEVEYVDAFNEKRFYKFKFLMSGPVIIP